jgi:1-deoxy-D-xylulose 5-phosphate reductoisomerase
MTKGLCILGSTGSVGSNTLRVVKSLGERLRVVSLSAGKNLDVLAQQILDFSPSVVSVGLSECIEPLRSRLSARGYRPPVKIVAGTEGQVEASTLPEVDCVVSSAHGVTGLVATYEAIRAGKQIGLANKETMVVAGELVTQAARERNVAILPIDSEHSAIHQCLRSGSTREVRRLILTGSGGPFLKTPKKDFDSITPERALKHPIWKMGGRITIDSATLMNKGLEIIEARWLFDPALGANRRAHSPRIDHPFHGRIYGWVGDGATVGGGHAAAHSVRPDLPGSGRGQRERTGIGPPGGAPPAVHEAGRSPVSLPGFGAGGARKGRVVAMRPERRG